MSVKSPVYIPVILGTVRQGRYSEHVAQIVYEHFQKQEEAETELIDIRNLPFNLKDEGQNYKDKEFAQKMNRADGLIIVTPEYNRSFPGSLKHVLDTNYKEYRYKPVGLCGVSAGGFGGARAIIALLPVMKTCGLYPIRPELAFSNVKDAFDEDGNIIDEQAVKKFEKSLPGFFEELVKVAKPMRELRA